MLKKLIRFAKENKIEVLILFLILFLASFLRLYKIDQYMTFLGDEGRDAIVVRRLLVNKDPILIGPGTSIGNMYLGPIYYYLMAPALFLAGYNPVGPAVQIAILGVATVFFVWYAGRKWFGSLAAIIASFLYAISPTVIIYSRSSWNPNIMPFFALLCIWSIYEFFRKENFKWLIILGISFAFTLQSHYLGLLLLPTIGLFWLIKLINLRKEDKQKVKNFISNSLVSMLLFSFLMSPLLIFDARHGWNNFSAIKKFFMERQATVSAKPWNAIPKVWPIFEKINTRLLTGKNIILGKVTSLLIAGFGICFFLQRKKRLSLTINSPYFLVFIWFAFAILGLGLYKQEIYDHYFGFFFPAPFILLSALTCDFMDKFGKFGKATALIILTGLTFFSFKENPFKYFPNNQMGRSIKVAQKIKDEYQGKPFNLAVIAERNYEDGYQYFLEKWNLPVIDIDPLRYEETVANQLFVVCEMPREKCDPTHNPKAGIANFGWSKIENEWEVEGVFLYKLIHSK